LAMGLILGNRRAVSRWDNPTLQVSPLVIVWLISKALDLGHDQEQHHSEEDKLMGLVKSSMLAPE
jgi:hypothetical protein